MIIPRASWRHAFKAVLRLSDVVGLKKTSSIVVTFLAELARGLVLCHFLGSKNATVRERVLGHQVYVSVQDKGLSQELLTYRVHEPILSALMLREIRLGDVVVEIGANIGYYVLLECSKIGGNGKVIAIEPYPRSRKLLKMNVFGNGYSKNVEFVHSAIGPKRGTTKMFVSHAFNLNRVISPWFVKAENGEEKLTKMMTLDELVLGESKIDVIRMDIEGYEFAAIDGMIGTLTQFRPRLLVIEVHPITNYTLMLSFFETLNKLGYEIKWVVPRALIDGILNIPEALLLKTCDLIQKPQIVPNVCTLSVEKTLGITAVAEMFCSSKQGYHLILTPKQNSSEFTQLGPMVGPTSRRKDRDVDKYSSQVSQISACGRESLKTPA
jgi:FkbM family methyltransferase